MTIIEVKTWTEEDFVALAKLDYTNTYDTIFSVSYTQGVMNIQEIKLPQAVTNASKIYTDEIQEDMIQRLKNENTVPLVIMYDAQPAGYLMAKREKWPNWVVLVIDGILVVSKYAGKWLAKTFLQKIIEIWKSNPECRGIHAEMDTTKYQANKLLLKSGFVFWWSKFFIYAKDKPSTYSKEAVYFYYSL